jgi:PTS system mannose-specific IIB component
MGPNDYMVIGLARIDRLIHGQVATRWTKETNVTRIIVVSDEVAADNVRKTLLTQVAPPGDGARGGRRQDDPRLQQPEIRG